MTKNRFTEQAMAAALVRGRWAGICLLALALHACKTPTFPQVVGDKDAGAARFDAKDAPRPGSPDTASPPSCKPGGGSPSKGKGEACSCDYECRTGHCAQGVCCASTCTDRCKACNLPNSLGDCDLVPAGAPPADSSQCVAGNPGSCGQDGTCDGKGGCQLFVAETVCSYGRCDGDGLSGVKVCDGKGHCAGDMSRPCAPYSCNKTTNECESTCSSNAQCSLGQECSSHSCGVKLNGYKCTSNGECASGHCSSGVCCNLACNGPCVSCALAGSYGRCRMVPAGQPDSACEKQSETTCGTTGLCDGSGSCALWPAKTTPCRSAVCSESGELTTTAVCNGKGTCNEPTLVDCSPYLCSSGQCNTSCRSDDDCQPGHACLPGRDGKPGTCSGKKQTGQPCEGEDDCDSGYCVDGVCCESRCEGACRSCALEGSPGRCTSLPAGNRDRRNQCEDEGVESCGRNGLCDGAGGCQIYPADITKCGGTSTCDDHNIFTDAPACTQAGQCVKPPSRGCEPYVCSGNTCLTSCSKDSDCVSPNTCKNHSCGKSPNGAECSSDVECFSGICAQGVCCNTRCDEACRACNLPSILGVCAPVADGNPDPQEKCMVSPSKSCGTTGACQGGTCAYFDRDTTCESASCVPPSSLHPASHCDGAGSCIPPSSDTSCGNYICSNNACLFSCKSDADCVPPNTCVNNSCGRKSNGAACTRGDQCSSGFCTEGVCCNSACADGTSNNLCMSCKVSGKVGTCSPVPDGQADPKQRCAASNPAAGNCSNDGTCNGRGGCRPWLPWVGCRQASCTDNTYTPAVNCDGQGNCPAAVSSKCDPYKCGTGASCLTTCKTDADCIAGVTCLQTSHRCGSKLANGQACVSNSDCSSNICNSEGVCCDAACSEACKSCTVPSHVGTCSNIANGGTPRDATTCAPGATCGNTGKCNGAGGCQQVATGTLCGAGLCAPKVSDVAVDGSNVSLSIARIPAPRCDGKGTCQTQAAVSCGAYQCDQGKCKTACASSNADCNSLVPSTSNPSGGNSCIAGTTSGTCQKLPNGQACSTGVACQNGNCVDGTCCEAASCDDKLACTTDSCALGGGKCSHTTKSDSCLIQNTCYAAGAINPANNCQACDPSKSQTGWSPRSAGTVCRAKNGACDVEETCDGTGAACPADAVDASGTVCRASAGACDVVERCDGTSAACPPDAVSASGTGCRAAAGACDQAERCDGTSAACPADAVSASGTVCRAAAGACDVAERCDGTSTTCPADAVAANSTVCRAAAGLCDVAERCDGASTTCPTDEVAANGTVCRAAAEGGCDVAERCDGSSPACPADAVAASGTVCRAAAEGGCDVAEECDGSTVTCPANKFRAATQVCREARTKCEEDAHCSGSAAACPANPAKVCPTSDACHTATCSDALGCGETGGCAPEQTCNPDGTCSNVSAPGAAAR